MNLRDFQATIKNLIIPAAFIATLILVGSWWFFSREPAAEEKFGKLTPVKITSVLSEKIKTVNTVNIKDTPAMPKATNIYLKESKIDGKILAKGLGFKGKSKKTGSQLRWSEKTKLLTFSPTTLHFSFTNQRAIKKGKLTDEEAVSRARQMLEKLGLVGSASNLEVKEIERLFIGKQAQPLLVKKTKKYDAYAISFGFKAGGYDVIGENANQNLIAVWIGVDKSIKKISGQAQPLKFTDQSTYKIKSVKSASEELKKGLGVLVNVDAPISTAFNMVKVRHTSVQLTYLLTNKDKYFQPVYLFRGTSVSSAGEYVEVKTLIPALAE